MTRRENTRNRIPGNPSIMSPGVPDRLLLSVGTRPIQEPGDTQVRHSELTNILAMFTEGVCLLMLFIARDF